MKKCNLVVCILFFITSCATSEYRVTEAMLPNGHWMFGVYSENSCDQLLRSENQNNEKQEAGNIFSKSFNDIIHPPNVNDDPKLKQKCIDIFKKRLSGRSKEL